MDLRPSELTLEREAARRDARHPVMMRSRREARTW
jgi:hypothetical protein